MKRNMIKVALFAVFAFVAGYGVYTSQKETAMSDLAMANVEALTWLWRMWKHWLEMRVVKTVKDSVIVGQQHIVFWNHQQHIFIVWNDILDNT